MQFSQWSRSCEISPGPGLASVEWGCGDESWQWPLLLPEVSSDAAEKSETQQVKIHSIFAPVNGTLLEAIWEVLESLLLLCPLGLNLIFFSERPASHTFMKWVPQLKRNGCCLDLPLSILLALPSCCEYFPVLVPLGKCSLLFIFFKHSTGTLIAFQHLVSKFSPTLMENFPGSVNNAKGRIHRWDFVLSAGFPSWVGRGTQKTSQFSWSWVVFMKKRRKAHHSREPRKKKKDTKQQKQMFICSMNLYSRVTCYSHLNLFLHRKN